MGPADGLKFVLGALAAVLLGIAVLVSVRLVYPPATPKAADRRRSVFRAVRLAALVIGLFALSALFAIGLPLLVLIGVALIMMVRYRRARQQALLATLAVAAERMIPLGSMLRAWAADRADGGTGAIHQAASRLEAGAALPEALAGLRSLVPRHALVTLRVGQRTGRLVQALRDAARMQTGTEALWTQLSAKLFYFGMLGQFVGLFLLFMAMRITPAFEEIFRDFHVQLPAVTRVFTDGGFWMVEYLWAWYLPLFCVFAYLMVWALAGWEASLPVLRRLTRRLDTAAVLDALALAAEGQRPLSEALGVLADHYPNSGVRSRLRRAAAAVQAGADWAEALSRRRLLPQADLAVLRAAQRLGNLAWALRELAESNRRRFAYRAFALLQLLFPLLILGIGLVIMTFVIGYFYCLVLLIKSVA
ncbi:MAG: type II secretion system F family protein [Thermoguttaceae bacterium]